MDSMIKTVKARKRDKRDRKVYAEYQKLIGKPQAMPSAVVATVAKELGICRATVYNIKNKMESNLNPQL